MHKAADLSKGAEISRCRGCKDIIYWVKTKNGNLMPINPDGKSHFATCPKADDFRNYNPKKDIRRAEQRQNLSLIQQKLFGLTSWEKRFIKAIELKFKNDRKITRHEDAVLNSIVEKFK